VRAAGSPPGARARRPAQNLRLVEMGDRLEVGEPIAALDEEALVELESIRSSRDGVDQAICPVVLDHLARALLEVGRCDDTEIGVATHALAIFVPDRILRHELEDAVGALGRRWQHDLVLPVGVILRQRHADCVVASLIAVRTFEDRRDRLRARIDAQMGDELLTEPRRVVRRVVLGEQQAKDPLGPKGPDAERADDRAVDAAR
jgi:hypothetical protein